MRGDVGALQTNWRRIVGKEPVGWCLIDQRAVEQFTVKVNGQYTSFFLFRSNFSLSLPRPWLDSGPQKVLKRSSKGPQKVAEPGKRGKGMTSRMLPIPVVKRIRRSVRAGWHR